MDALKKQIRMIDLALSAAKKRQSARTGFVHFEDTIPIYENFCFCFTLFRHKTAESITEGKELLERLLAFQAPDGNFPVYLHDFPKCWDYNLSLKIAPILLYLQRLFGSVLGPELKEKVQQALQKIKRPEKAHSTLWENRIRALQSEPLLPIDTTDFNAQDWTEWLITAQLAGISTFTIPFHRKLQAFLGPIQADIHELSEPRPSPLEWLLSDGDFSPRLLKDHPHQLHCAPLFPLEPASYPDTSYSLTATPGALRLLWNGKSLHSLVASKFTHLEMGEGRVEMIYDLSEEMSTAKGDLFEVALFCDVSAETELFIENRKGSVFRLGEHLAIKTPELTIDLQFELIEGTGNFCGHIYRSNRSTQVACKGPLMYEAFDWQIGLRTLRREKCKIKVILQLSH